MTKLMISGFRGANRRLEPNMVPEELGVTALNIDRRRSDLRPWKSPSNVQTVPSGRLSIYRMGRDTPAPANYWLSWTTRTDVIRGFNPLDAAEKTYITGWGTEPRWTDNIKALTSPPYPTAFRILGVPAPTTAAVVSLNTAGASGEPEEDFYVVHTFVTDEGEEGSISPPQTTAITDEPGAILNVSSLPAAPSGSYGINRRRIYLSRTGSSGVANFYFMKELPIGTTSTTINTNAIGEVLETLDYDMPPSDGHSLIALWNGIAAMASGKMVYFCLPYTMYAWPIAYRMPQADTIVGLGAFEQTLVVLTTGNPAVIQGQEPSAMSASRTDLDQACVSKPSIVSFGFGVVWASPDGLWVMTSSGSVNLTEGVMSRADWQAMLPATIVGVRLEEEYLGRYNDGSGDKMFLVNPRKPENGIVFFSTGYQVAHRDTLLDATFVLSGVNVQQWDAGAAMSYTYRTKEYRFPEGASFGWCRVVAKTYNMTLKVYCDGVLRLTRLVTTDKPFRLGTLGIPSRWQFELTGSDAIQAVLLGTNRSEVDG